MSERPICPHCHGFGSPHAAGLGNALPRNCAACRGTGRIIPVEVSEPTLTFLEEHPPEPPRVEPVAPAGLGARVRRLLRQLRPALAAGTIALALGGCTNVQHGSAEVTKDGLKVQRGVAPPGEPLGPEPK